MPIVLACNTHVNSLLHRSRQADQRFSNAFQRISNAAGANIARPCRAAPSARLEYRLLGGFGLTRAGSPVLPDAWERPMAARVVRFLLVHREFVPEDQLLETFWRDRDPVAARRCLTVSVSRCRAVLRPDAVLCCDRAYRLVLDPDDSLDVDAFEHAAALALAHRSGHERLDRSRTAPRACGPGSRCPRTSTRTGRVSGATPLPTGTARCSWRSPTSRPMRVSTAPRCARRAGCSKPTRSTRERIAASWPGTPCSGRRSRALEQYLRCRRLLVDSLGVEPARETAALHARILAGEEGVLAA